MRMLQTRLRVNRKDPKDKDREITEYVLALINLDQVVSVVPLDVDSVYLLTMSTGDKHLVKDHLGSFCSD